MTGVRGGRRDLGGVGKMGRHRARYETLRSEGAEKHRVCYGKEKDLKLMGPEGRNLSRREAREDVEERRS